MKRIVLWTFAVIALLVVALIASFWAGDKSVAELSPRWAQAPSKFLAVNGMQVHYRDEGPRDDSLPLVLIHGTSSSLHTWQGWTDSLRATHRVIRFDLPGFGLTGPDPNSDYSIANHVRVTRAVLDSLRVRRAVVVGNSLGGAVAAAFALDDTARVAKLVLVDAAGYPNKSTSVPVGFRIARIPVLRRILQFVLPRSIVEQSVRSVFGDPSKVTPALVDRYYELTLRRGNRAAVVESFRMRASLDSMGTHFVSIRVPTLIIWGAKDGLISPDNAGRFHQDIAGSELTIFSQLGHIPHEEDPAATVQRLKTFLETVAPRAPKP
jgi:pimeloyl-ACP methyl ester carboxylesterase